MYIYIYIYYIPVVESNDQYSQILAAAAARIRDGGTKQTRRRHVETTTRYEEI